MAAEALRQAVEEALRQAVQGVQAFPKARTVPAAATRVAESVAFAASADERSIARRRLEP